MVAEHCGQLDFRAGGTSGEKQTGKDDEAISNHGAVRHVTDHKGLIVIGRLVQRFLCRAGKLRKSNQMRSL